MLVLARKKNQSIIIGDNIEVFIVDVSHDQVKLGIKAPKSIAVNRKEVYENVKQQMQEAVNSDFNSLKDVSSIQKKNKFN